MIYPILDMRSFGSPVRLVERNLAIDPSVGPTSDGILFLVPVGGTRFMIDQRGRFYYNAEGDAQSDWNGRVGYLGPDRVQYDWNGRIADIGPYHVYYDSLGKLDRISDAVVQFDSYTGLPSSVGGVYFYYEYNYGTSRHEAKKIADCSFYYQAGGKLEKICYYGRLPGSPKDPWVTEYTNDNTVYIYYDYSGKINKIGSTSVY